MRNCWLLLCFFVMSVGWAAEPSPLDYRRERSVWRSPTTVERRAVLSAVRRLSAHAQACPEVQVRAAQQELSAVGLILETHGVGEGRLLVLREPEPGFGAGLLAIRCGEAQELVWQAPHPRYDRHTGGLVRSWFVDGDARAAMFATHHRYRSHPGEQPEDDLHPADVAVEPGGLFQAMTVALASGSPDLRFVQVHGYKQASAPGWSAVLSSGARHRPLRSLGERLRTVIGDVAVYGVSDVGLGGTRNVQARAVAPGQFAHLELSPTTRDRLRTDALLRQRVLRALLEGPW